MAQSAKPADSALAADPSAGAPDQTAAIWERYVAGQEDAASRLFDRYLERLTALARSRLSARFAARVDADDVVMSAYRSLFIGGRDGRFSISRPGDLWRLLVEITLHKLYRTAAHHLAQKRSVRAEGKHADDEHWPPNSREPPPDAAAVLADELAAIMKPLKPAARRVLEMRLQGESLAGIWPKRGFPSARFGGIWPRRVAARSSVRTPTEPTTR